MAVNNRTEAKSAVSAAIVPAVSNADHITLLNDELNESYLFRKDVIGSEPVIAGAVTVDYSDKDTAVILPTVNTAVSFTGLENGDVKYLIVGKLVTNDISFVGAINTTNFQKYINDKVAVVPYVVYSKNSVIYVSAIVETIIEGSAGDITLGDSYKYPTCNAIKEYRDTWIGFPWTNPSYNAGFSAGTVPLQYRIYNGTHVELRGDMLSTGASGIAFTLNAGSRPATARAIPFYKSDLLIAGCRISDPGLGDVESTQWDTTNDNTFNSLVPLT